MAIFKRKDASVNAVQWNKDGDSSRVKLKRELLVRGWHAYAHWISPSPTHWVGKILKEKPDTSADKETGLFSKNYVEFTNKSDGSKYYRELLSFSFWSVKGEKKYVPINDQTEEEMRIWYEDCLMVEAMVNNIQVSEIKDCGVMAPPASDGRLIVYPGDWIVSYDDRVEVMSDKNFKEKYSQ